MGRSRKQRTRARPSRKATGLRGVVGVDPDVVRRQIAGPHHRLRAPESQVDAEADRFLLENGARRAGIRVRSEEHTSELQSQSNLVCRLLLEKKKKNKHDADSYTDIYN